ncbi:MAG: YihY/virulence factor BrkB family protein [Thermodesulfobacteriota bacterium]
MDIQHDVSHTYRQTVNIFRSTIKDPFFSKILVHAAALSFKSTLSLVPILALVFSVGKGFGVQEIIEPIIMKHFVGGGVANDIFPQVLKYVENTNVKALGTIGLLFILYTAISMVSDVEEAFNLIWSVKRARSLYRKFTDYLSVLAIGPLFLGVMLSVSPLLSSHTITQKLMEYGLFAGAFGFFLKAIPWLASIFVITLLYLFIPNTKVKLQSALVAGIIGGLIWQFNQILFIKFQIGVSRYNAIYGTFATVPILLLWLQAGWVIILAGAILSNACQNRSTTQNFSIESMPYGEREKLLLLILTQICQRYDEGNGESGIDQLSSELMLPEEMIRAACDILIEKHYLVRMEKEDGMPAFMPEKPPEAIGLADFFINLKKSQQDVLFFDKEILTEDLRATLDARNEAIIEKFNQDSIVSLYKQKEVSPEAPEKP